MRNRRAQITEHGRVANASGLPALCLAVALAACGDRSIAAMEGDGTSGPGSSDTGMSDAPAPPDLGPDAVVCGEPGEYAAEDEAIALLAGCEIYQGRIVLSYPEVTDISPLASLRIIREDLAGSGGEMHFETLEGLEQLEWLGSFHLAQKGLRDMSALGNLRGIDDGFQFLAMPNVTDFRGLEQLRTVGGGFSLVINPEMTSLAGLSGLEWIGGDLLIEGNDKLTSLAGLSALEQIDGDVTIHLNAQLPLSEIDALLSRVEIGGEVDLD